MNSLSEKQLELEKQKQKEFSKIMFPELTEGKINNMVENRKTAAPLDFPDIGGAAPANGQQPASTPAATAPKPASPAGMPQNTPQPMVPPSPGATGPTSMEEPKEKKMTKKEMEEAIEDLQSSMQDLDITQKLITMRREIIEDVALELKRYRQELDEFMHKKMPERKLFDTGGAYKEHIYGMCTQLLDEIVPYLFESLPEYSLISTSISSTYEDGTVENAMVAIRVTVDYNTYKYDFKVDVPVLNGIIQSPLYFQRGIKVIPLTKEAIEQELNSISFRRTEPENQKAKPNIFNNVGENPLRRKDNQKFYEVVQTEPKSVGLPPHSMWEHNKGEI